MDAAIQIEEETAATEFPSLLRLLIKKTRIFGSRAHTCDRWNEVIKRPPPLSSREEKHRGDILLLIDEGWETDEWAIHIPIIAYNHMIFHSGIFLNTKSPKQHGWIKQLMGSNGFACQSEEIGKALTDRTRVVRKLSTMKQRTQSGTRDRGINSEQLEFECQFRTPIQSRHQELQRLVSTSSHNLFQSLIFKHEGPKRLSVIHPSP